MRLFSLIFFKFIFWIFFFSNSSLSEVKREEKALRFSGTRKFSVCHRDFELEIADTIEKRQRGFMNRPEPSPNEGILFVFESSAFQSFWMKNVPFDLDILFFDSQGKFVDSFSMRGTSPLIRENALPIYTSRQPARYAVELRSGTLKSLRLKDCRLSPLP